MTPSRFPRKAMVIVVALLLIVPLSAQRRRFGFGSLPEGTAVEYDGRFTIVRLWYANYPGWSFDYPDMEQNLTLILNGLTAIDARPDGSNIMRMDDPELSHYPIAYLSEQ